MWIAYVTRLDGTFAYVRVPDYGDRDREFGPLEPLVGVTLVAGDRVLVGQLTNHPGDLVLIRKLP